MKNDTVLKILKIVIVVAALIFVAVLIQGISTINDAKDDKSQDRVETSSRARKIKNVEVRRAVSKNTERAQTEVEAGEFDVVDNETGQDVDAVSDEQEDKGLNEGWELIFDKLVEAQNPGEKPTKSQVLEFVKAFNTLSDEMKLQNIPHALNLFSDDSVDYLTAVLYDVKQPKDVLDLIYHDIMNRPEELKMPIFRKIAADEKHPLSEDALDILIAVDDPAVK